MNKEKVLSIQNKLKNTIDTETKNLQGLKGLDKAKTEGVLDGAKFGYTVIERVLKGKANSEVQAYNEIDTKIKHIIYALFAAEAKVNDKKEDPNNRIKHEIAYNDNLLNTLQLIKRKMDESA